jgi:hypothetical protein
LNETGRTYFLSPGLPLIIKHNISKHAYILLLLVFMATMRPYRAHYQMMKNAKAYPSWQIGMQRMNVQGLDAENCSGRQLFLPAGIESGMLFCRPVFDQLHLLGVQVKSRTAIGGMAL